MRNGKMPYKDKCGFKRLGYCSFKPEDCNPESCDMFNLHFSSSAILVRLKEIQSEIEELQKETLNTTKIKEMIKKEKEDKTNPEVLELRKKLFKVKDLISGYSFLRKAYIKTKREGK